MNTIGDWIIIILFMIYVICCVTWGPIFLYHTIKCFKVFDCHKKECRFHKFCDSYKEVLTEEEAEILIKMLEKL